MSDTIPERTLFILQVLDERRAHTVDSYDEVLLSKFDISPRQLTRLLDDVVKAVGSIEVSKIGK